MSGPIQRPLSAVLLSALSAGLSACSTCDDSVGLRAIFSELDVDYLAHRTFTEELDSGWLPDSGPEQRAVGTPCDTATDKPACLEALAAAWPGETAVWRNCYWGGCDYHALVATKKDRVMMATELAGVVDILGGVDSEAKAIFLATRVHGYSDPGCFRAREKDDGFVLRGRIVTSDCPDTVEEHRIRVAENGALTKLKVLDKDVGTGCAGRRPAGLAPGKRQEGDVVGMHLASMARLEAASVVAFERLAAELSALGAPERLVQRAHQAAHDEVRHAQLMHAQAAAHGAQPLPVEVAPPRSRDLLAFAIENAVEGCVRETYGALDAAFRAHRAPTEALRALYAEVAVDEVRHAALAWDIAAWLQGQLSAEDIAQVQAAMGEAHRALRSALSTGDSAELTEQLGAPTPTEALAMADTLRRSLAA